MTIPGEAEKLAWFGGDATPELAASQNHRDRVFAVEELQDGLYAAHLAGMAALWDPERGGASILASGEVWL